MKLILSIRCLPGIDEDGSAVTEVECVGIPPDAEAQPDDCGHGGVGGDHPGAPGGSVTITSEAGAVVDLLVISMETIRANHSRF